ncbi:hypothetical protein B0A55_13200 [Friedmanniomyces simplex]|uniref:Uncharacterized protein n=1 Tax=Friedmanniomyces simplex TaxID=329884 RepID=A0A4U0VN65_9PEZI|nr:hypothetical protein B0A55_13200 [Friedmanniomyces simplex]
MTALPKDDPALRKLDPTLLVIGNLARQYKVHHRNKSVSFGTLVLQQFGYAGLANELFHKGGLVRMLLWLPAAEKYTLLPISEMHRRSMNARLSVGSTITETVGSLDLYNADSTFYARRRQRAPVVEAVLADRAQRWMHDHGMQRPTGRPFLYNRLEADASEEVLSPFETTVSTWRDLEAEIDTAEARFETISSVSLPRSKERRSEDQKQQVEATLLGGMKYPQCGPASTTYHETGLRTPWLAVFADMGLRIMNLEVALCVVEEKAGAGADYERARDRILKLDAGLEACILQRQIMLNLLSQQIVDQQQACLMEPPLMAIDARNYEPLKAAPDEFWPKNEIMLLDVVPKSRDLSVPDLASKGETARLCEALLKGLLESSSRFLPESLERVAPNAARDLLPLVPAARDPRKGGRLNPNRIRVRMISEDVIVDLLRAWMEWPFKPSMTDLELASESEEAGGVTEGEVESE